MAIEDNSSNKGLFMTASPDPEEGPSHHQQHKSGSNSHDECENNGDNETNADNGNGTTGDAVDDGSDDDEGPLEIEGVPLKNIDDWCVKGQVFKVIRKYYHVEFRLLAKQVDSSAAIRGRLEDFARSVESSKTNKHFLVRRHHSEYMRTITKAVTEITRYLKSVEEINEKLAPKHRLMFEPQVVNPTKKCLKNAEKAKTRLINLIKDLRDNLND